MDFKDILKDDINSVFLNLSEFGTIHKLNDKKVNVIIDDDMLDGEINLSFHGERQETGRGLYNGGIALYVASTDFGKPKPGSTLTLDGNIYTVISASEQDGMRKITLRKVGGR